MTSKYCKDFTVDYDVAAAPFGLLGAHVLADVCGGGGGDGGGGGGANSGLDHVDVPVALLW